VVQNIVLAGHLLALCLFKKLSKTLQGHASQYRKTRSRPSPP